MRYMLLSMHCLGQHSKHPVEAVKMMGLNTVTAGTDVKPEEITKGAHKRKRREGSADLPSAGTDVTRPEECIKGAHKEEKKETKKRGRSADPPNTVHVSREGAPPADHFSMPPEPPALTGFHHGHAIRNEDSLVGSLVTGRVDSRIDCGYFVSLNINGYTFQGIFDHEPLKVAVLNPVISVVFRELAITITLCTIQAAVHAPHVAVFPVEWLTVSTILLI